MAKARLIAMLLASTAGLGGAANGGLNDGAHFAGGNCIYNGSLRTSQPSPADQGVAFGWYQNIGTSGTQTVVESGQGQDLMVEYFRKTNGTMVLHLFVGGTKNGVNGVSEFMNIYSATSLVTTSNTPAYWLAFWDSYNGRVVLDMNGVYDVIDSSASFTVGTPFGTLNTGLPWTVGCHLAQTGAVSQFLIGDLNQLWIDQSYDEYDLLTTPGALFGAFVQKRAASPYFTPLPLGYLGTGIFGLNHGAPIIFLQGSGGDGLFNKNFFGDFSPLTTNPGTTFNFPWSIVP